MENSLISPKILSALFKICGINPGVPVIDWDYATKMLIIDLPYSKISIDTIQRFLKFIRLNYFYKSDTINGDKSAVRVILAEELKESFKIKSLNNFITEIKNSAAAENWSVVNFKETSFLNSIINSQLDTISNLLRVEREIKPLEIQVAFKNNQHFIFLVGNPVEVVVDLKKDSFISTYEGIKCKINNENATELVPIQMTVELNRQRVITKLLSYTNI